MPSLFFNQEAYFGEDSITKLTSELADNHWNRPLLIVSQSLTAEIRSLVLEAFDGIHYKLLNKREGMPKIDDIAIGRQKAVDCDVVIAVGGSHTIDLAKAISTVVTNDFIPGETLTGEILTTKPLLPIVAVPTLTGTASEATIYYLYQDNKGQKYGVIDPHCIPYSVFIDPVILASATKTVIAETGMDAFTHAIEAYVSKASWPMTDMYAERAIQLLADNLVLALDGNKEALFNVALAEYLAGRSFTNAGLGLVQSMARPLSEHYQIPKGVAAAALLPHIMAYNQEFTGEKYRFIANAFHVDDAYRMSIRDVRTKAVEAVHHFAKTVGIPEHLSEFGMSEEDLPKVAQLALLDNCLPANPRKAELEEVIALYDQTLHPHLY